MFSKKSTLEKRTSKIVKNISKAAKKNPTAAVAVGGGIITAGVGSIVTSITLGAKLRKMKKTAAGNTTSAATTTPATTEASKEEAISEVINAELDAKATKEKSECNNTTQDSGNINTDIDATIDSLVEETIDTVISHIDDYLAEYLSKANNIINDGDVSWSVEVFEEAVSDIKEETSVSEISEDKKSIHEEEPVIEENPEGYPAKKQSKKNGHKK